MIRRLREAGRIEPRMDTDRHRLEPAFDFGDSGSSVLLQKGQAEVRIDGNSYTGEGEVCLDLLPRPNIHLYGSFQGLSPVVASKAIPREETTSFSFNGREINGLLLMIKRAATAHEINFKWSLKFEPIYGVGDESTQMTRVVFHLFNFDDIIGTRWYKEQRGTTMGHINHVDLICDEWKVELKSLFSTRDNIEALKAEGGYRLTHIGLLEKADGAPFSGKDADECLRALRFFLSFAKGTWCEPVCAVGFDASGNRVWEFWSSPKEPWQTPRSWFDRHNGSQLVILFPGFMKRWANDDWHEALDEIIYWYLRANNSSQGTDAGVILTQAAIERLSYEYSVKDKQLLSVKGFKDLRASDKFRLLFSSLGIPLDIPAAAPELQRLAPADQMNWLDAPHALTKIRNSLIHPEHKSHGQLSHAISEAWNLGLWYLEMGILAVCGYSGAYGNRLKQGWVGETERVPWE